MKRGILVASSVVVAALVARQCARGGCTVDLGKRIAAMPDSHPAKWMYTNVTAIRENTERILGLMEGRAAAPAAEPETALR